VTIKDRGTRKWNSFWIPDHVQMVHGMFEEEEIEKKPELDEQELEEMNAYLYYALHEGIEVEITYYSNHRLKKITSKIQSINMVHRYIILDNEERMWLSTEDIVKISLP